jgi:hypothetical protein
MKQNKFVFYWKKKNQNCRLKKTEFFKIANFHNFFVKISWIGPWFGRIDWFEGRWCSLSYMVMRLSHESAKTPQKHKKCIFCLFLSLRRTVSQPYRLSHINALCINQSYQPKDQSMKFSQKSFENWRFWKTQFFGVGHFEIFFSKKKNFFTSSLWKSVKDTWGSRIGWNFDDYTGLQQKSKCA